MPGLLVAFSNLRLGLAWMFAGGFLCAALAINGVSISRVTRLFFAVMVSRNLGVPHTWLAPSENELSSTERTIAKQIEDWFRGKDIIDRRGRYVLLGILFGAVSALGIVIYDLWLTDAQTPKLFVFSEQKTSVEDKIYLLFFTVPAVVGAVVAMVTCPAYGRPILSLSIVPGFALIAMLIAGFDKAANMALFFAVAAWLGMGLALLFGFDNEER